MKKNEKKLNKNYWDKFGSGYSNTWKNPARLNMHLKEMEFINMFLGKTQNAKVLDVGVGTGRILKNYLKNPKVKELYGLDISNSMVNLCKKEFKKVKRVKSIKVCDVSRENIPFDSISFDFISSIRVIKYNKNWKEIVGKIAHRLKSGGMAIFTMPNNNSLNRFGHYSIPYYRTTKKEIQELCKQYGLKILDMQSFTRIPDVFYDISSSRIYISLLIFIEKFFSLIFGKTFLGRMFFIAVEK